MTWKGCVDVKKTVNRRGFNEVEGTPPPITPTDVDAELEAEALCPVRQRLESFATCSAGPGSDVGHRAAVLVNRVGRPRV